MFLLDFLRYIRGYVQFRAEGDFVERFLNLVARDRIPVWDSRKRGCCYTGCTTASSYRKLRAHARKTGVRLRLVEKTGAPFQRRKYRRRAGLLVGVALFAGFLFTMSLFVWRIEINGNETVSDSAILQTLETIGIGPGTLRRSIDVRDAEGRMLLSMPDLSWAALNIDGSVLRVEVNETVEPPEMVDPSRPCNLVAAHAGQILSIFVYDGQGLVQAGDAVAAGDILVSGITEDRTGKNLFKHALADVTAQVELDLAVEVPLAQTELRETGASSRRGFLNLFGLEIPLFLPLPLQGPYRVDREERTLALFSLELPVSHLRETYLFMEEVPVTYSEEQAKELALLELALLEKARLDGAEIQQRTAKGGLRGESFVIEAHYLCTMEIAVEKEILLSE